MTKPTLESTLKSADTEEWLDLVFYRPIGYRWALLAQRLGITPNAITIASMFIGAAAGWLFYFPDLKTNIIGMLLLILANSFDSADGQLARMTGLKSPLGRWLDGFCGDVWFAAIYIAICLRFQQEGGSPYLIWALAAGTGYFHSKQASMADYYRNFHLFFLKNKNGSEFDQSADVERKYNALSWKNDFVDKLGHYMYVGYTRGQEKLTPGMQQLVSSLKEKYNNELPVNLREEFRSASLPLMKYTNILSFNTRVIALFIALFIGKPWLCFVFEITVLNSLLVYMVIRHESICKEFFARILRDEF
jgi:Phosphatidylglycerophosphate synthase